MKHIWTIALVFLIAGCSQKVTSTMVAETAKETISAAYKSLPTECRLDSVKQLLDTAKAQIDAVKVACDTEKDVLEKEVVNLELLLAGLIAMVILLFYFRKKS